MSDLKQQRNAQIIAPLACAQDSARQLGSGAEHKTAKELLEEGNNNKINYNIHRASGRVCLLLPLSCGIVLFITNILLYVHFFSFELRKQKKRNEPKKRKSGAVNRNSYVFYQRFCHDKLWSKSSQNTTVSNKIPSGLRPEPDRLRGNRIIALIKKGSKQEQQYQTKPLRLTQLAVVRLCRCG